MASAPHLPGHPPSPKTSNRIVVYILGITFLFVGIAVWRQIRSVLPVRPIAQDEDGHYVSWPCALDADRFCPHIPRGGGRVNACLRQHTPDLSRDCIDYMESVDPSNDWNNVCREELH